MKKKIIVLVSFMVILLLGGCGSTKEGEINNMKFKEKG